MIKILHYIQYHQYMLGLDFDIIENIIEFLHYIGNCVHIVEDWYPEILLMVIHNDYKHEVLIKIKKLLKETTNNIKDSQVGITQHICKKIIQIGKYQFVKSSNIHNSAARLLVLDIYILK